MSLTPRSDYQDALPTKGTKALVGAIVAFVTLTATGLVDLFPDPTVNLVLKVILLLAGTAGTAFGVYQTTNAPKEH